ncbi:MAG: hypothetical protein MHM6MM_000147 [Cercozoa sp. M6MM]
MLPTGEMPHVDCLNLQSRLSLETSPPPVEFDTLSLRRFMATIVGDDDVSFHKRLVDDFRDSLTQVPALRPHAEAYTRLVLCESPAELRRRAQSALGSVAPHLRTLRVPAAFSSSAVELFEECFLRSALGDFSTPSDRARHKYRLMGEIAELLKTRRDLHVWQARQLTDCHPAYNPSNSTSGVFLRDGEPLPVPGQVLGLVSEVLRTDRYLEERHISGGRNDHIPFALLKKRSPNAPPVSLDLLVEHRATDMASRCRKADDKGVYPNIDASRSCVCGQIHCARMGTNWEKMNDDVNHAYLTLLVLNNGDFEATQRALPKWYASRWLTQRCPLCSHDEHVVTGKNCRDFRMRKGLKQRPIIVRTFTTCVTLFGLPIPCLVCSETQLPVVYTRKIAQNEVLATRECIVDNSVELMLTYDAGYNPQRNLCDDGFWFNVVKAIMDRTVNNKAVADKVVHHEVVCDHDMIKIEPRTARKSFPITTLLRELTLDASDDEIDDFEFGESSGSSSLESDSENEEAETSSVSVRQTDSENSAIGALAQSRSPRARKSCDDGQASPIWMARKSSTTARAQVGFDTSSIHISFLHKHDSTEAKLDTTLDDVSLVLHECYDVVGPTELIRLDRYVKLPLAPFNDWEAVLQHRIDAGAPVRPTMRLFDRNGKFLHWAKQPLPSSVQGIVRLTSDAFPVVVFVATADGVEKVTLKVVPSQTLRDVARCAKASHPHLKLRRFSHRGTPLSIEMQMVQVLETCKISVRAHLKTMRSYAKQGDCT